MVHFDVMDGHFVPNLTFGLPVLRALVKKSLLPIDVHLMVTNPERLLDAFLEAGPAWLSVHWEAATHLDRLLRRIREAGVKAGVALNPATPVELLIDSFDQLDFVLLMSVNPGFAGQPFLPYVLNKAQRLRSLLEQSDHREVQIAMDGGIDRENIRQVVAAGVDLCVAGSAVFAVPDPAAAMQLLREQAQQKPLTRDDQR